MKRMHNNEKSLTIYRIIECQSSIDGQTSQSLALNINRARLNQIIRSPLGANLDHIFRGKKKITKFNDLYKFLLDSSLANNSLLVEG